jgi:hypothetical protein
MTHNPIWGSPIQMNPMALHTKCFILAGMCTVSILQSLSISIRIVFSLLSAQEESPGFELVKDGCTIVTVRFSEAVPAGGIQMIAYAESDGHYLS